MKTFLAIIGLLLMGVSAYGQSEGDELQVSTDRPSMGRGAYVVEAGHVQLESGVEFGVGEDNKHVTLPTTQVRWGVTKFAELRLQYDGVMEKEEDWKYVVRPLTLGAKFKVFDGWKGVPQISFLANLLVPVRKDGMHAAPQMYFLFHNQVKDWFSVDYNAGAEWNGEDNVPSTFLSCCLGFGVSSKWGLFAESYNYLTRNEGKTSFSPNVNLGCTYLLRRDLQLDACAGFSCKEPKASPFIGLGVSWLIK